MNPSSAHAFIPLHRIESAIQVEPVLILLAIVFGSWLSYGLFLRGVSAERHRLFSRLFRNLLVHTLFAATLLMLYWALHEFNFSVGQLTVRRFVPSVGLLTLVWASIVFVKACRILAFEYLFLINMRAGVPLLLVNLLSLLLSLVLAGWILSSIFEFNLGPVLATSAIFSVVIGLALQDTLGNLFAGVALQLDKPYEIGDWIEVSTPAPVKYVGQVQEISWRATNLVAFTEEIITIPNRIMAQSEVCNFSAKVRPFIRGQIFRLPFGCDAELVKGLLLRSLDGVPQVLAEPAPIVLVIDQTESWVTFRLIYYMSDFGSQYRAGDRVITTALRLLEEAGIRTAGTRMHVDLEPSPTGLSNRVG